MQNYFFIETEVAHRRWELERELAAAEQRAQVRSKNAWTGWSQLVPRAFAYLRALATARLPVPSWNPAGVKSDQTLEGGRATAT